MPLVTDGGAQEEAHGPGHEEARKINPRYAKGELVRVAVGRNLSEAELIKGVLLEQGIPSLLRRTGGFDVPDFLAAGPRDVLVPSSGEALARDILGEVDRNEVTLGHWDDGDVEDGGADATWGGAGEEGPEEGDGEGRRLGPGKLWKAAAIALVIILALSACAGVAFLVY